MSGAAAAIRIFSRAGCHLCEREERAIRALALERGLGSGAVEVIDIESDDALLSAMLERIPVVALDGLEVGELDRAAAGLAAALDSRRPGRQHQAGTLTDR